MIELKEITTKQNYNNRKYNKYILGSELKTGAVFPQLSYGSCMPQVTELDTLVQV